MMRAPIAAFLTACLGASIVGAAGCAASTPRAAARPTATAAVTRSGPGAPAGQGPATPAPAAASPTSGVVAAATPTPAASAAESPGTGPAASAAESPGTGPATAAPPASSAASSPPGAAVAGSAPDSVASAGSSTTAAPSATTASAAGPNEPTAAAPAPLPGSPPTSPHPRRVMLTDEPPYVPGRLRARDAKVEHHHGRDGHEGAHESRRPYHPAPGIVVDVVGAQGGASAATLQRAARNLGYWPFRQCYEEGLRRDQRMSGRVSLELVISPSGAVDRSAVAASSLRDEIVGACLAREALRLALPASESPTTARVDVSLAVGDEPVPLGRPVPGAEPIRDALRGQWSAVRRCYASRLASHPGIGGRMELHFHLRHGEIVEVDEMAGAGESGGRFGEPDVTRCVLGVYRTARLPASHGAREHSFVYALHLESAEGAAP
jgi:hypothetical protein